MTIGILSNISVASLAGWLNESDRVSATRLSANSAPSVTTLALEWLKAGHRLVVFTLDPEADDMMVLKGDRLTVYVAPAVAKSRIARLVSPFGRDVRLLMKMIHSADEHIDVVSVHWTRDYAIAARYFLDRCKVFVTVRDIMPYIIKQIHGLRNYAWYVTYLKNEYVMRSHGFCFIANSDYTAESVKKYWGMDVPVIPNPVDDRYLEIPLHSEHRRGGFSMATISMSVLDDKRKNIPALLDAFAIVRTKYPDVSLELIGPSFNTQDDTVIRYMSARKLRGVSLVGSLPHDVVVERLRHVDLMVHPSLEETFGNTLVESMAVGCPVLGGENAGAVPSVLDYGRAGFLCDITSADAIADKIMEIIENPELRQKIAEAGREYCRSRYSSAVIAARYISMFES
ncbi:MAG: glycosyltransferase family 4 protein [Muribaculum sp.]|nr:glycosyltransferase family 4 protein [Muribaculum sp.]